MMKHRTSTSRLFHHLPKQTVLVVTDHINYTILLVRDQHCAEQALKIKIEYGSSNIEMGKKWYENIIFSFIYAIISMKVIY